MTKYEQIMAEAKKCLKCKKPLCIKGCPLENPIPYILKLVEDGKIKEASEMLFENTNASIICSRLCDFARQCVGHCVLNKNNNPVLFYQVEEYLSKYFVDYIKGCKKEKQNIAIIGSGISGISCAIDLRKKGYDVTIYEQANQLGGVLSDTMPLFRFDKKLIQDYEKILKVLEVKLVYNKKLGANLKFTDLSRYNAIILAMGTMNPKSTLKKSLYLLNPLEILRAHNNNNSLVKNKKILVIGGGNVALDVARTIKKWQNETTIVYRRDMNNAPSSKKEIEDARNEGINFIECAAPVEMIFENNVLVGLKVEKMILVNRQDSNRKMFKKTGEFFNIETDYIVEAIGLDADYEYVKKEFPNLFNESGLIIEDAYIKNNNQIIIATGDYFSGASNFVNATSLAKKTIQKLEELL